MRKISFTEFITLDGVIRAPGGADEDTEGGFGPRRLDSGRIGMMTSVCAFLSSDGGKLTRCYWVARRGKSMAARSSRCRWVIHLVMP